MTNHRGFRFWLAMFVAMAALPALPTSDVVRPPNIAQLRSEEINRAHESSGGSIMIVLKTPLAIDSALQVADR